MVVVRGTDPVTYEETWREPAGTLFAFVYKFELASEVTVTFPTKEVLPLMVRVSVVNEGLTPIPTVPMFAVVANRFVVVTAFEA